MIHRGDDSTCVKQEVADFRGLFAYLFPWYQPSDSFWRPCTITAGVEYWRLFSVHESIDEDLTTASVATVTPAAVYKSVNDLGLQMIPKEIESLRLELSSNGDFF